ncbi:M56 family metallopeptidase [Hymenobacter weizhouensis]|uniref:M56 family metallopeptidase n=1 Tax=Hymenobacter sp. YIM 151500-1 TaxID=2987689 RepID=UPI002227F727|nr:M56 family metallopeptidase [Hymenobacter sp. YIM 151500-1]UYZ63220.1 M56 family metallopeptidase [Hymenobacter sp. YIM 151500-1]
MNWLEHVLPPALVRALGWTLVHSLWQGAVVALALAGLLLVLRRHRATVRYTASAVALVLLLGLAAATFARYYLAHPTPDTSDQAMAGFLVGDEAAVRADGIVPVAMTEAAVAELNAEAVLTVDPEPTGLRSWLAYFDNNLPVLVAAWLLGLLAMTLRLLGGLAYVQRLRRYRVQPLAAEWQERLAVLADRAGLKQPVELLESALVRVPVVVGYLRPVVLLPLGTVSGLSTAYLEAILAHELAHVQRRDYVLNLVQSVAETLFFYHPAVWFITACLRTERENCCDDIATSLVGGNPLTVARALAALAELSAAPETPTQLALSALGPDGSVLGRIRRLVQGRTAPTFSEGVLAACVVLGGLVLLTSAVALADPRPASPEASTDEGTLARLPFLETQSAADTTKRNTTAAPAAPAPLMPKTPAVVESDAAVRVQTDDDGPRRNKRNASAQQPMIIVNPGTHRGGAGTVVIEKDKKGRVTNLTVNGQPVEAASSRKKGKGGSRVEVVQVPDYRGGWANDFSSFDFHFNPDVAQEFNFRGSGIDKAEVARMREQVRKSMADARLRMKENALRFRKGNGQTWSLSSLETDVQRKALVEAERALQNTLKDENLSEEAREQIQEQLEELREERSELRERFREDLEEQVREAEEELHDQQTRRHDEEMQEHARQMQRHAEDMRRLENEGHHEDDDATAVLTRQLRQDGLITDEENFQFSLSPVQMTVNGKKQPTATRDKYLRLWESKSGSKLTKGSININRQSSGRRTGSMPAPLRPLRPARPARPARPSIVPAPPASPAPPAPVAPPAPPAPPRMDTDEIREQLRKDGLVGASDKSFQFQLNDDGLVVNGQKQPAALADKYRRLLDAPDAKGSRRSRNIQISVSE